MIDVLSEVRKCAVLTENLILAICNNPSLNVKVRNIVVGRSRTLRSWSHCPFRSYL